MRGRLIAAAICLLAAGCAQPKGAELLARAEASLAQNDYRAAVIDLKNLLRVEPENPAARLAMGRALLGAGDMRGATLELRRASELGVPEAQTELLLGRALSGSGEHEAVIREIDASTVAEGAPRREVLQIRGEALLAVGRVAEAREALQAALALDDRDVRTLVDLASLAMAAEGFDAARPRVDEALRLEPANPLVWRSLGILQLQDRQFATAEVTFEKAVKLAGAPDQRIELLRTLSGLAEAQLALGKVDAAKATIARVDALAPASPTGLYLQARAAFLTGDYDGARRGLEQLLSHDPKNSAARLLLGAVNYTEGNLGQADMYLASVVASEPDNSFARKLLADTRMRQRQPRDALKVLEPDLRQGDRVALSMAGWASLQAGDLDAGLAYLQQGVSAHPDDAQLSLQLAAGYLAAGRMDRAVAVLENLKAGGDAAYQREVLLLTAKIRSGDREAALAQARRLVDAHPEDSLAHSIIGGMQLAAGERLAARSHFERAVQLAPKNPAALLNLGKLELLEGKLDSAEQDFKAALALKPGHPALLVASAQLALARGDVPGAIRWLEKARSENPQAIEPRVLLGQYYLAQREFVAAQQVALEANQLAPEDPAALNILGLTLTASGRAADGVSALEGLARRQPESAQYRFSLARAYLASGSTANALASAREAVKLDGKFLPAHALMAALLAERGEVKEAEQVLVRMRRVDAKDPTTRFVEGDLAMLARRYAVAATAYGEAQKVVPSRALAQREYLARRLGGLDAPTRPLDEWLADHPQDDGLRLLLAQAQHADGQQDAAVRSYEQVIARDPRNATALNNVAWLQLSVGQKDAALRNAERAYELQSNLGDIVDTYGWALLQNGQASRALELLRKAHGLAPRTPEIRYHLAAALAESGSSGEAREHLQQILSSDERFPSRQQATELLARLGKS